MWVYAHEWRSEARGQRSWFFLPWAVGVRLSSGCQACGMHLYLWGHLIGPGVSHHTTLPSLQGRHSDDVIQSRPFLWVILSFLSAFLFFMRLFWDTVSCVAWADSKASSFLCLVFFFKIYLLCIQCFFCIYACIEEGAKSHYRWLWATMWLLGIELRTSGRAGCALNHWAISLAPSLLS